MVKQDIQFDFGAGKQPTTDFVLYEKIIQDRGSIYSVSVGRVTSRDDITQFLKKIKSKKKYAKATHNSWAARITKDGAVYETKQDDGETGAGQVILRIMQGYDAVNAVVCVTRWFGGVKLMGDRFRHIQDASKYGLEQVNT